MISAPTTQTTKKNPMKLNSTILFMTLIIGTTFQSRAQHLSISQYLHLVGQENLGYAAEKYNVNIAEAGMETARIFPDPEFSAGAFDNQQSKLKLGQGVSVGLATTIELGGKRSARIALAKSELEQHQMTLQDYFRNLRADAAIAYYEAIHKGNLLQLQQSSHQFMEQLANADAMRYKLGVITETDARQSKLEASILENGMYQYEADLKAALVKLSVFAGQKKTDSSLIPEGNFKNLDRSLNLYTLVTEAQQHRADALFALIGKTVAKNELSLAKANRVSDLGINTGLQFNGASTNEEAPTPDHRAFNVGISLPLKFSNRYRGELKSAQFGISKANLEYEAILQQIQSEVTQAYLNYIAAQKRVQQYQHGPLKEANQILEAKIYSYTRGEIALLEVLNARRTYNEIQQSFYEAQASLAITLIELERVAGFWDLK